MRGSNIDFRRATTFSTVLRSTTTTQPLVLATNCFKIINPVPVVVTDIVAIMLKRTGTKQRIDDRTTNLSRLIMDRVVCKIELFVCILCGWEKCVVTKPVNPRSVEIGTIA